jgi:hypothetical protein
MDLTDKELDQVAGSYEHGNEYPGSIMGEGVNSIRF